VCWHTFACLGSWFQSIRHTAQPFALEDDLGYWDLVDEFAAADQQF
jgi:hypothetical protein